MQLVIKSQKKCIYSKLDSFGPAKDRSALPNPVEFVTTVVAKEIQNLISLQPKKNSEKDEQDESSEESEVSEDFIEDDKQKLEKETVLSLRKMLRQKKLPTSGRKSILIERLCAHTKE